MKRALIERNIVIVLFIIVLITFSLAQRDTEKMDKGYVNTEWLHKSPVALKGHKLFVEPAR